MICIYVFKERFFDSFFGEEGYDDVDKHNNTDASDDTSYIIKPVQEQSTML